MKLITTQCEVLWNKCFIFAFIPLHHGDYAGDPDWWDKTWSFYGPFASLDELTKNEEVIHVINSANYDVKDSKWVIYTLTDSNDQEINPEATDEEDIISYYDYVIEEAEKWEDLHRQDWIIIRAIENTLKPFVQKIYQISTLNKTFTIISNYLRDDAIAKMNQDIVDLKEEVKTALIKINEDLDKLNDKDEMLKCVSLIKEISSFCKEIVEETITNKHMLYLLRR